MRTQRQDDDPAPGPSKSQPSIPRERTRATRTKAILVAAPVALFVIFCGARGAGPVATPSTPYIIGRLIGSVLTAALPFVFVYRWVRGTLTNLVVGLCVLPLFLGILVLVGRLMVGPMHDPGMTSWKIEPGYRIAFPTKPGPTEHVTKNTKYGVQDVARTSLDLPSGAFYILQVTDVPPGTVFDEGENMATLVKQSGAATSEKLGVTSNEPKVIGSCSGRSFVVTAPTYTIREYDCRAGSRVYSARVGLLAPARPEEIAQASAFLDSFSVDEVRDGG